MTEHADLLHYMNGKPVQSAWRKQIAKLIIDTEDALDMYCRGTHKRVLEVALEALNRDLKHDIRSVGFRLSQGDPWTCLVKERLAAIQTRVELLVASGQL